MFYVSYNCYRGMELIMQCMLILDKSLMAVMLGPHLMKPYLGERLNILPILSR